ncbi:trypsin iota [Drosophila busckii]|nr:trypsin iota [Drosophila busckii]
MYWTLLLLFLCCAASSAYLQPQQRIVGGNDINIYNAPWQVSLQLSARHVCGGCIYSKNIIITAAHCVEHKSVTLLQVRVGAGQHNSGGKLMSVADYKLHELYDAKFQHFDIALLRLSTDLTFGLTVRAIGLASSSAAHGQSVSMSGWGSTEPTGSLANNLQSVQLQIIERENCASSQYGYGWLLVGEETICAAAANKDACAGDAGGALVADNNLLVGIVSRGYDCALANYPGVYVDVAKLRAWIIKTANEM